MPGSYLLISHVTGDTRPESAKAAEAAYARTSAPATLRTRAQIEGFFTGAGFALIPPGLVPAPVWRPDVPYSGEVDDIWIFAGVGRKDHPR